MREEKKYLRFWKKVIWNLLYAGYLLVVVLLLLEIMYRFQVIEFYQAELNARNPKEDMQDSKARKTILVFGDSFSVQDKNYSELIRKRLSSDYRTINSAITGSSIVEAAYIAPKRIKTFDPDIFIYQIYVGNDLLPITHSLNWEKSSWIRNIYWWLSERINVLSFINYRLGQFNWRKAADGINTNTPFSADKFTLERYRPRERLYAQADPYLVSNSVLLKNGRLEDFNYLAARLNSMLSDLKPGCKTYLVVIPHKSQVNAEYFHHMSTIGFRFDKAFNDDGIDYPFVQNLKIYFRQNPDVQVLNPLQVFRENSLSQPLYYFNDEHLNEVGHKVLSEFILSNL